MARYFLQMKDGQAVSFSGKMIGPEGLPILFEAKLHGDGKNAERFAQVSAAVANERRQRTGTTPGLHLLTGGE
uniref:Uncharacterized protein n=1 Tax=uncultured prokaryote TaxID=198431 RepID=A0A0H5Q431_9ZZZZ|nr:hypothetical protein [uncultured prokaryote]